MRSKPAGATAELLGLFPAYRTSGEVGLTLARRVARAALDDHIEPTCPTGSTP